ncbi:unnamed protein product [Penicillium glandicola]
MSSNSPSKQPDLDPEAQSGEEQDHLDKDHHDAQGHPGEFEVKEQDRWLPIANVARIMKLALPDNAKIAKEAKECMQDEASEKCQQEKRKTVNGEDILFAMTSLGFENYAEALKIYLSKYRETQSARGDNQRPPSAGYGAGGPVGGPGGAAPGLARPTGFPNAEGTNPMSNLNLDPSEQDASAYGYPPIVGQSHNGAGGESY